ncbi:Gfo/Idh/MocA family protein [Poseidonocella sedimentorum]|uniref:Predicted dehydrogenase n=1 Tax=Poseidonocella sedimentorum TaxID=871652 RepID=A0A1I6DKW6_9RHOB|nr:Gfo/Idh/MocA family oxidoreductase [Poseidonocella sedimentorum]SFR06095.1 Predicted dehydrogenase [Poseidonocella sedimentorum]
MPRPGVLLLAYSQIARRRILPALAETGVTQVDIASRSAAGDVIRPGGMSGRTFPDYEQALEQTTAPLVWISTVNSTHLPLAELALSMGKHVVLDKPATLRLSDARSLAALAQERGVLLAEATVYAHHPQIAAIRRVFADAGSTPRHVVAAFSFPALPGSNFRHDPALGGGMLQDLGPYAMSLGRVFFDAEPQSVCAMGLAGDHGFSITARYCGGRTVAGHFGTLTGYVNRATLLGPDVCLDVERLFTTDPTAAAAIRARVANTEVAVDVPGADAFATFLTAVFAALRDNDPEAFLPALISDARAREMLSDAIIAGSE